MTLSAPLLGAALLAYVGAMFAIGLWARRRIHDTEDYLTQRLFAARSERVAARACWLAGAAYLAVGCLQPLIGLAANLLAPEAGGRAIVLLVAQLVLDPGLTLVFALAVAYVGDDAYGLLESAYEVGLVALGHGRSAPPGMSRWRPKAVRAE